MIDQIINAVNEIFALAPAPFTIVVVIVFGYVLRGLKFINNNWIPTINHIVGTAVYAGLNMQKARPDMNKTEFAIRVCFTGLVISYAAWKFHENILASIEDKIPLLKSWIQRGNAETPPPATPTPPTT